MNSIKHFSRPFFWVVLASVTLGGCADFNRIYGTPERRPAPVYGENHPPPRAPQTYPIPAPPRPAVPERREPYAAPTPAPVQKAPPSPAVVALLSQAESSRRSGDLDAAVATTERALRIEPRNAKLLSALAALRLQQNQPGQAEGLAKKSNVLAGGDRALMRKNWQIIAEARRRSGDLHGAAEAERRANAY